MTNCHCSCWGAGKACCNCGTEEDVTEACRAVEPLCYGQITSVEELEADLKVKASVMGFAADAALLALRRATYRLATPWYLKLWHRWTGQHEELR